MFGADRPPCTSPLSEWGALFASQIQAKSPSHFEFQYGKYTIHTHTRL